MVDKNKYQNTISRSAIFSLSILWTLFIVVLLRSNWINVEDSTLKLAAKEARSSFNRDVIYRSWNASHGGVYATISENTPSNPYLANMPERDITTPSGVKLTLVNPAYMVRQVHELSEKKYGTKSHITSLNPLRPKNIADEWEKKALMAFENGKHEVITQEVMKGDKYLRFMRPLIIEEGCLNCHRIQGYKLGDIRGGISVSVPLAPYDKAAAVAKAPLLYGHFIVWLLGLFGIISAKLFINRNRLERNAEFERIVSKVSSNFIRLSPGNADDRINHALASICEFTGADRGFVFQLTDDEQAFKTTNKWSDKGSDFKFYEKFDVKDVPWSMEKLKKFEMIHLTSLDELPLEAAFEKELLKNEGSCSLIGVPLVLGNKLKGILCVDKLKKGRGFAEEDLILMQAVGETIIHAIDRDRAVKELAEQKERFDNIIKGTNVGTWEWNIVTGETVVNERWAEILGYTLKEISPVSIDSWVKFCHPKDLEKAKAIIKDCFNKRSEFFDCEIRMLNKNQDWVWIRCTGKIATWTNHGKPKFMYGTHTDINNEKKQEAERLKMHEKLQYTQRLDSLGVMAGGIAHDFNNILMAIMGNAELGICMTDEPEKVKESFSEILSSSGRAADLCSQMLAFTGKGHLKKENISLNSLILEMSDILKTSISKKNYLNIELRDNIPDILVDPIQIRQVLINLVVNASEAMEEEMGEIRILTGNVYLSGDHDYENFIVEPQFHGPHLFLEVSDKGHGLDRSLIKRIFEPFYTTKFTGRGLGLSAVVGIVIGHNGALTVNSEPGNGSNFKVFFPAAIGCSKEKIDKNESEYFIGKGTVLLVDDEETVRNVSLKMLEKLGLHVLTAADGYEAFKIFKKRKSEIDVVLMDHTMPNMSGYEAVDEIRKINPDIKVVLATGYSERDIISEFQGRGIISCLEKPYTLSKLRSILHNILTKSDG